MLTLTTEFQGFRLASSMMLLNRRSDHLTWLVLSGWRIKHYRRGRFLCLCIHAGQPPGEFLHISSLMKPHLRIEELLPG